MFHTCTEIAEVVADRLGIESDGTSVVSSVQKQQGADSSFFFD